MPFARNKHAECGAAQPATVADSSPQTRGDSSAGEERIATFDAESWSAVESARRGSTQSVGVDARSAHRFFHGAAFPVSGTARSRCSHYHRTQATFQPETADAGSARGRGIHDDC